MACLMACLMASLIRYADADEAPVGTCLKDEQLRDRLQLSTSVGFAYTIEGTDAKMKPGIVGRKPGDVARFCLDVSRLPRGEPFVLILGHLISYEHMGIARVTCVDDCACEPVEIDGHVPGGRFSVFKAMMITATRRAERTGSATHSAVTSAADCGCTVEVRIRMRQPSSARRLSAAAIESADECP